MIACDASLSTLDKAKPSSSSSIDDLPAQVELDRLEKERAKPFMKMIGIGIIHVFLSGHFDFPVKRWFLHLFV